MTIPLRNAKALIRILEICVGSYIATGPSKGQHLVQLEVSLWRKEYVSF